MLLTLLFYFAFALGEICFLVLAINTVHGMGWKLRWLEAASILGLVLVGLVSLELTRRWWLVPVGDWPLGLKLLGAACSLMALVGLPVASYSRLSRTEHEEFQRKDQSVNLVGNEPPERFMGRGRHNWLLRVPGNQALGLVVHHWSIPFENLPRELDGLSILHLTDLHFSHAYDRRYFEAAFDVAAGCLADLVFITGDLIDDPSCMDWITHLFDRIPALVGRYAILGNHDHHHDTDRIMGAVAAAGYSMLDGDVTAVSIMKKTLAIGGTCAPWGPKIDSSAIPPADFRLLLSHTPDIAYQAAAQGWDFMLCGHNHGGQVQLPIVGPVVMPSRYSRRFESGFYRIAPTLMYVSRGLGAKHPIRLGCPPEIAHFTLTSVPSPGSLPPTSAPRDCTTRHSRPEQSRRWSS